MDDIDNVSFHLLPFMNRVYNEDDFNRWYEKTLAYVQGKRVAWKDVYQNLIDTGCYANDEITPFGKISVQLYFSPKRLTMLREKLKEAYMCGSLEDAYILSWVLASEHIPMADVNTLELSEYKNGVKRHGLVFECGELIHGFIYYCILNNKRPRWLKSSLSTTKDDVERLFRACMRIAELDHLPIRDILSESLIKAIKRVPDEIAKIMNEFNLEHKSCAYELMDMNITTKEDLQDRQDYVMTYGTESLKKTLHEKGLLPDLTAFKWRNRKSTISS